MASSSLVANIIINKFVKYLPLYRQEKLFRNVGLDISRANMSSVAYSIVETALAKIKNKHVDNLRKLLPYSNDLPEYLKAKK